MTTAPTLPASPPAGHRSGGRRRRSPRHSAPLSASVRSSLLRSLSGLAAVPAGALGVLFAPLAALLSAAVAATRRPALLSALTVLLVALPGPGDSTAAQPLITAADAVSALLVGAVALRVLGRRQTLPEAAWPVLSAVLLALGVATVNAQYISLSLQGFVRFSQLFVLVPAAVAISMRDAWDRRVVLGSVVLLALIEGAVGTWQTVTGTGASFGGQYIRAVGTFGALNIMAMSVIVGIGLLIALGGGLALRGRARLGAWIVVALLTPPLIFSLSRGTWIGVAFAAGVMLLLSGVRVVLRTLVFGTALAVVLVGGFGIGAGVIADRLGSITSSTSAPDSSVSDRYDLWHTAVVIWKDHPVTGVGPKNFPKFRDSYAPLGLSSASDVDDPTLGFQRQPLLSPHNMYLLVLSEQGLLGALAFAGLLGGLAVRTIVRARAARRSGSPSRQAMGLAMTGLIVFTMANFAYGDAGGAEAIFGSVILGMVLWWAFAPEAAIPADLDVAGPSAAAFTPTTSRSAKGSTGGRPGGLLGRLPRSNLIFKAAFLTAALVFAGSLLGLVRDLLLAVFFGATGATDAFLVAWTVPETAAPLLIEEAMAFLMVPLFSRALAEPHPGEQAPAGQVPAAPRPAGRVTAERHAARQIVAATLPRIVVPLTIMTALVALAAPYLVTALAPRLADPALATTAMRIIAITVLMYGLTGYMASALRSHHVYTPPAVIYVVFNIGVLAAMLLLHRRIGVLSVALGVSIGATLMVLVQLPAFLRHVGLPRRFSWGGWMGVALLAPIGTYMITRQAQVFVERFLGSALEPGTISHLNYAQKVAQVPMTLAVTVATVTFPILARELAGNRVDAARRRVETDLTVIGGLVLMATAYILAFAPQIIEVLFQHGDFTAADTAATAGIIRIYCLGLLGQGLVGVLVRTFFSGGRVAWYPAAAMIAGLLTTTVFAASTVHLWGARALAGGNALGITVTAALMLAGVRGRRSPLRDRRDTGDSPPRADGKRPAAPLSTARVLFGLARSAVVAALAAVAARAAVQSLDIGSAIISALVGGLVVVVVFLAVAGLTGSPEIRRMTAVLLKRGAR